MSLDARLDARRVERFVLEDLEPSCRAGRAGHYARRMGGERIDVYGVADMACILHTVGRLDPSERDLRWWARAFASLQDPETGAFVERDVSHLPEHATAFSVAAMALLELQPEHPVAMLAERDADELGTWLDDLDWREWVYLESHKAAGIASLALLLPDQAPDGWAEAWWRPVDAHLDPRHGLHGDDKAPGGDLDALGGTFHHLFVYEHLGRELAHPEARIDAVLAMQRPDGIWDEDNPWWMTLDGAYVLSRASEQTDHRTDDIRDAVRAAVAAVLDRLAEERARRRTLGADMGVHATTAVVTLIAEAQRLLGPSEVMTSRPWCNVLDARPFV